MSLLENIQTLVSLQYLNLITTLDVSLSIGDYVLLYGMRDIEERNSIYEVQLYMPGWVAIGDDSGGQAILMRLDGSNAVYRCDHGALGSLEPALIAESLAEWIEIGCPMRQNDDELDDSSSSTT
jgi:hypothetical protein